ncbi:DsrH/TusB family sulfur metabolism protein [Oleiphilus sp. HI0123]
MAATIFVLTEDALARGVKIPVDYCKIDYNDLVELTIKHEKVHSWY